MERQVVGSYGKASGRIVWMVKLSPIDFAKFPFFDIKMPPV